MNTNTALRDPVVRAKVPNVACSYCTTYRPKPVRYDTGTLKEVEYSAFFQGYSYWYTWRPRANDAARYADVN